jgi:RNA polymerase sigma-70 factor, ECF subfamily
VPAPAPSSTGPVDPTPTADPPSDAFASDALGAMPHVARFARSLTHEDADADDLVQDTYLRAFRAWRTFEPGSDVRRWLFTICKHQFLRTRRREARFVDIDGPPEADTLAAVIGHSALLRAGADDLLARIDAGPAIRQAIDGLPTPFRVAVVLVDVEGYGYEDAASVLEVPIGTVRSRLFRARRLLQEALVAHARDAGVLPTL